MWPRCDAPHIFEGSIRSRPVERRDMRDEPQVEIEKRQVVDPQVFEQEVFHVVDAVDRRLHAHEVAESLFSRSHQILLFPDFQIHLKAAVEGFFGNVEVEKASYLRFKTQRPVP